MSEDKFYEVLTAKFWAAFGSGATMPFTDECVAIARNKGYYDTVRHNIKMFMSHPEQVERAMRCCIRAGHLAAERAIHDQRKAIEAQAFVYACDEVEMRVARIRQRAAGNGDDFTIMAGVCATL